MKKILCSLAGVLLLVFHMHPLGFFIPFFLSANDMQSFLYGGADNAEMLDHNEFMNGGFVSTFGLTPFVLATGGDLGNRVEYLCGSEMSAGYLFRSGIDGKSEVNFTTGLSFPKIYFLDAWIMMPISFGVGFKHALLTGEKINISWKLDTGTDFMVPIGFESAFFTNLVVQNSIAFSDRISKYVATGAAPYIKTMITPGFMVTYDYSIYTGKTKEIRTMYIPLTIGTGSDFTIQFNGKRKKIYTLFTFHAGYDFTIVTPAELFTGTEFMHSVRLQIQAAFYNKKTKTGRI